MQTGLKLIDNNTLDYQLGNVIKELLLSNNYSQISIATGYWDIPGMVEIYEDLKIFLERDNTSLRLLLGEEPTVKAYQVKNPAKQDPDFP
ncbi:MAG: hypothetical protein ABIF11_03870, partial [Nitrospirota bacterium]